MSRYGAETIGCHEKNEGRGIGLILCKSSTGEGQREKSGSQDAGRASRRHRTGGRRVMWACWARLLHTTTPNRRGRWCRREGGRRVTGVITQFPQRSVLRSARCAPSGNSRQFHARGLVLHRSGWLSARHYHAGSPAQCSPFWPLLIFAYARCSACYSGARPASDAAGAAACSSSHCARHGER